MRPRKPQKDFNDDGMGQSSTAWILEGYGQTPT